jgi:hypothetical protein
MDMDRGRTSIPVLVDLINEVPGGLHVTLRGVVPEILLEDLSGLYTLLREAYLGKVLRLQGVHF